MRLYTTCRTGDFIHGLRGQQRILVFVSLLALTFLKTKQHGQWIFDICMAMLCMSISTTPLPSSEATQAICLNIPRTTEECIGFERAFEDLHGVTLLLTTLLLQACGSFVMIAARALRLRH